MQPSDLRSAYRGYDLDETTLPGAEEPPAAWADATARRFIVRDAELRFRPNRGCMAIGLYEARSVCGTSDSRLIILVVWRSSLRELGAGRYRIEARPSSPGATFGVSAYLTYGDEWLCFDAARATEGRIAICAMSESAAAGAFDVTFGGGRFHGTFLAKPRS